MTEVWVLTAHAYGDHTVVGVYLSFGSARAEAFRRMGADGLAYMTGDADSAYWRPREPHRYDYEATRHAVEPHGKG